MRIASESKSFTREGAAKEGKGRLKETDKGRMKKTGDAEGTET